MSEALLLPSLRISDYAAVRAAKLQQEAAGEISGLLAMLQPDTPSPRKHRRKGNNPKSSYSMFARPASVEEADEQGQSA